MTEIVTAEVIELHHETSRVRARNAIRAERSSVELLPPDVNTKVNALRSLDGETQARAVTAMLSHARTGLLAAIAAQDLPQILEFKRTTCALQEVAKQLRLGKDMQLDAAEFVRRAERGLGVALRDGQLRGVIETKSEARARGAAQRDANSGRSSRAHLIDPRKPRPLDFATPEELNLTRGIFGMTDGVSDAQFEAALAEAKDEGNPSRANVARKARAKVEVAQASAAQEPKRRKRGRKSKPPAPALAPLEGKKHQGPKANSTEMLERINGMLGAIVQTCQYIDPAAVDPERRDDLVQAIRIQLGAIRGAMKGVVNG